MLLRAVHDRNASGIVCLHCSATCSLQLNWSLVTGDRGHGDKSLWHMQTQYQHNIYTNLSQNFVDTFIKYHLLSIIYTLYAAGVRRDCVKWHGGVYRESCQPHPTTPVFHKTRGWQGRGCGRAQLAGVTIHAAMSRDVVRSVARHSGLCMWHGGVT